MIWHNTKNLMITNKLLFDSAKRIMSGKVESFSHLGFIINDKNIITNELNFKLWRSRKNIKGKTYKNYIHRAAKNTLNNYFRTSMTKLKKENPTYFLTKVTDGEVVEYIPDILDNKSESNFWEKFEEFFNTLLEIDKNVIELKLSGMKASEIAIKYNINRRNIYKRLDKIKKMYNKFKI